MTTDLLERLEPLTLDELWDLYDAANAANDHHLVDLIVNQIARQLPF